MALTPGTKLGPYEVLSAVGAGGMGEVYRAKDTRLEREVAVKVLPSSLRVKGSSGARSNRASPQACSHSEGYSSPGTQSITSMKPDE